MIVETGSFLSGIVYGFLAAGFIAIIANQMRQARIQMGLKNRSMDNFPDAAQPNLTSSGVVQNSRRAAFRFATLVVIQILVIGFSIAGVVFIV